MTFEEDGVQAVPPLPRQLKVVDCATLLELERLAARLSLNQRLDVEWLEAKVALEGGHYLWPALWNVHSHRADPELVRHLRCELLLRLRSGEQVLSLLDMRLADFDPLPTVRSRAEGMQVASLLDSVPTVRQWQLEQPDSS
jgi:hypothetical protein